MPTMVDSCVILDIFSSDPRWYEWSSTALAQTANEGRIVINPVIYSEVSIRFERIEDLEPSLPAEVFECQAIPREAAFLAGKCFRRYRKRGGKRTSPLPGFFIGAHAAVLQLPLLTRDARRFRDYFPRLDIICP